MLVAEGAIEVVVPLLSLFQPAEPSYLEYVVTRCGYKPSLYEQPPVSHQLAGFSGKLAAENVLLHCGW